MKVRQLIGRETTGQHFRRVCSVAYLCLAVLVAFGARAFACDQQGAALPDAVTALFSNASDDHCTVAAAASDGGRTKLIVRGELFDGRALIRALLGGLTAKAPPLDADLDIAVARVVGFNGVTLQDVSLKFAGRPGEVRDFRLSASSESNARLSADLRTRRDGRRVIYLETADAGAFFRLTDLYPRLAKGEMWMALDASDNVAHEGVLNVRDAVIQGETLFKRLDDLQASPAKDGLTLSRLRIAFKRSPGSLVIDDVVAMGPVLGATSHGSVDFAGDAVHLSGTIVPLDFNQAGDPLKPPLTEGLVGVAYEVVGRPQSPTLLLRPMSLIAPGVLRKLLIPDPDGRDRQ
jgi:hypothetical protein